MRQPEYIIRHISGHKHVYKLQENTQYRLWGTVSTKEPFKLTSGSINEYSYESLQMSGHWQKHVDMVENIDTYENLFIEIL